MKRVITRVRYLIVRKNTWGDDSGTTVFVQYTHATFFVFCFSIYKQHWLLFFLVVVVISETFFVLFCFFVKSADFWRVPLFWWNSHIGGRRAHGRGEGLYGGTKSEFWWFVMLTRFSTLRWWHYCGGTSGRRVCVFFSYLFRLVVLCDGWPVYRVPPQGRVGGRCMADRSLVRRRRWCIVIVECCPLLPFLCFGFVASLVSWFMFGLLVEWFEWWVSCLTCAKLPVVTRCTVLKKDT